jgi:hypothetical protein
MAIDRSMDPSATSEEQSLKIPFEKALSFAMVVVSIEEALYEVLEDLNNKEQYLVDMRDSDSKEHL